MRGLLLVALFALTATQSLAVPECPPDEGAAGDILLPNPADCTTFYKCLNGVPYLMPCPPGLQWSDALKRCEYPEIAQCKETEEKPTTTSTTKGPTTPSKPRPDKCPEEDGPEDVLLPNPADCGSFFKCLNGVPHLIQCPAGQEWSIELNRCDYPEIAQCEETETSVATKPSTTSSTSSKPPVERPDECPEVDGPEDVLLPNPADCGSFFKCLNGVPHLIQCPVGQEWSIELNRCDYPEIAKCKETESNQFIPIPSHPKENGCPAEDGPEDVLLPNPANCGSFYKCLAGTPVLHYCPPGLHWSVKWNRCEYPEIAQCKETESSEAPKPTTAAPSSSAKPPVERPDHCPEEDGPEDVLLPNPEDCGSFYKCLNGIPQLILCPPGLHWSIELNRCEYPAVAQCKQKSFKSLFYDTECPLHNDGYDVLIPNPEDCTTYFQCSNGVKILKKCPEGTLWDAGMARCDHEAIAKCA